MGCKTSAVTTSPLKWTGGKHYLAKRIIALFTRHVHYCEPYFGGGSVLFARNPDDATLWLPPHKGVSEVVNDLNGSLTNFWRVIATPRQFDLFRRRVEAIPMSRPEWDAAVELEEESQGEPVCGPAEQAVAFFVRCRQSRSGMMKDFTSITRNRTRRGMNGNVSEWLGAVEGLPEVHARLRRVLVENMDGVDLIKREDTENTLFYVDPPYLHDTRTSKDLYEHEMTGEDHARLLVALRGVAGKVVLSGYPSEMYSHMLHDWRKVEIDIANHAAGGRKKRRMTETIWMNYDDLGRRIHA